MTVTDEVRAPNARQWQEGRYGQPNDSARERLVTVLGFKESSFFWWLAWSSLLVMLSEHVESMMLDRE